MHQPETAKADGELGSLFHVLTLIRFSSVTKHYPIHTLLNIGATHATIVLLVACGKRERLPM